MGWTSRTSLAPLHEKSLTDLEGRVKDTFTLRDSELDVPEDEVGVHLEGVDVVAVAVPWPLSRHG